MGMKQDWHQTWKRRTARLTDRRQWRSLSFWKDQLTTVKLWRNLAILFLAGVIFSTMVFAGLFAWYARDLPQPDRIVRREGFSTKIMDRNSGVLYEVYADQQRTPTTFDQLPETLKQAVVAIEDKNFYAHGGFDRQGYIRILWNALTRKRLIGGSTLTQQLVKNVLLSNERTLTRKLKEFILAVQIENRYNKDQILVMYLNEAPYGGTAWGVATASELYFGKQVSELNLLESAILAGLPQRPSYYSPVASKDKEAYKGRTQDVLRRMREDKYITADQEKVALEELAAMEIKPVPVSIRAPHFTMYVKDLLIDMYGEALVEQGGLRVTTTLDYDLHQKAQTVVTEEVAKVANQDIGNGAAVVMDPNTGEILAMVGSKDFFAKDYDGQVNVALSLRQPGSTIKPVTYATAFARGITPATMLMDVPTKFPGASPDKPYEPKNYDGSFRGPVQLRFALGSSLNIPAVKLLALVGIEDMMQTAFNMGLTTLEPTKENMSRFGLALTLGGGEVRLVDLTTAYSAFANGGMRVEPVAILKVEDRDGKLLYQHKETQGKRVLEEGVAFLINHVLTDNNARLMTFGANSYLNMGGRPVAVKTGTTNDRRDNWTIGWSNSGMVGVWVGNNDNSPMKSVTSGITGASPIWRRIMLEVLTKYPATDWKIPGNVEAKMVDVISGYPEHDGFPSRAEYVINGTLPPLPDPIHRKIRLCRGQDKLATPYSVEINEFEEKVFITPTEDKVLGKLPSWKEQNQAWAASQGDSKFKAPTEYCDGGNELVVKLDKPGDKSNIDENEVTVEARVISTQAVTKVEVYVNGVRRETLSERPYTTTLSLADGKYTLRVKAFLDNGETKESGEVRIGVGGVAWDYTEPAATPVPTASPVPTPQPTVLPSLDDD
jgi:1A family penicillin-binding protein